MDELDEIKTSTPSLERLVTYLGTILCLEIAASSVDFERYQYGKRVEDTSWSFILKNKVKEFENKVEKKF